MSTADDDPIRRNSFCERFPNQTTIIRGQDYYIYLGYTVYIHHLHGHLRLMLCLLLMLVLLLCADDKPKSLRSRRMCAFERVTILPIVEAMHNFSIYAIDRLSFIFSALHDVTLTIPDQRRSHS